MDSEALRGHLEREVSAYAAGLARACMEPSQLDSAVAACPGWDVRDLTHHLIGIHYWVIDAINGRGGEDLGPPPAADRDLVRAFSTSSGLLLDALDGDPTSPCWTIGEDHTLGFWQRRQPHEHSIHRWDLETALGLVKTDPAPVLDPQLSTDGIDEVVTFFWPRQVAMGRAQPPSGRLEIVCFDSGGVWYIDDPATSDRPVVATLAGPSPELLLTLWKRRADQDGDWTGDAEAGRAVLGLKLVP